jgi:bifunctional non-homologous end joining protein LigD
MPCAEVRLGLVTPMKAVLTAERPAGAEWVFERKLDGIRCLAVKDGGGTQLYSRNELSLTDRYASLAIALDADPADRFVIDGEAVSFVGGRDRFGGGEGGELFLYVFDVLFAGGRDVRSLPLEERREILERLLRWRDPVRTTEQMTGEGAALLVEACRDGWEGLIAKRLGRPYVSTRSRDWLKLKCTRAQELVIGGFTAPRGSRTELGALLVGHFAGDRLRYAGKVGTGFSRATLLELAEALAPLVRETSPFEPEKGIPRAATWVEPELVARSPLWSGPPTGVCAIRPSWACASTGPRARSSARSRSGPRRAATVPGMAATEKPQVDVPSDQSPSYQLELEDLTVGDGEEAVSGRIVEVHYVGVSWKTGEQFDASWDRGSTFKFGLGKGQVIAGWDQGVAGMKVGGRRRITIPPMLAYGKRGAGGVIGPDETLIFVVDLVDVH